MSFILHNQLGYIIHAQLRGLKLEVAIIHSQPLARVKRLHLLCVQVDLCGEILHKSRHELYFVATHDPHLAVLMVWDLLNYYRLVGLVLLSDRCSLLVLLRVD